MKQEIGNVRPNAIKQPGDMRPATNAASAEKMAGAMAPRHIGVAAYAVTVDEESGSMANPRLLVSHGLISDLMPD
ncbi:hypothetical protein [Agrobacterium tumefaciens]|uniref:Uncharacterized protein n=1 Tax=Agrobacterium tumefaciens TaxID=358 RepID=A0A4D7YRI6_AGRTU|nr:hypothetical protein [Agrobacterium tumefaciens]QCL97508.1 hypothetical protein CFBP7129_17520 [Agrobacterium tumefaciens]